jgi:hypothetical protein
VGTLNYEWGPPRDRKQGLIFEQRWQNCWFYVLTAAIFLQAEGRTILAVAASGHTHDSGVPSERVPGRTQCSGNLIANTYIDTAFFNNYSIFLNTLHSTQVHIHKSSRFVCFVHASQVAQNN